ncbi:hypothetical protein BWI89_28225 (plasmid) [Escherichia coli]|nr:hypothetical protein BWI89_28225 [Escherichia coli]
MPDRRQICLVLSWKRWNNHHNGHLVALGRQTLAVQRLEEQQKYLQKQTALVRAELYRAEFLRKMMREQLPV